MILFNEPQSMFFLYVRIWNSLYKYLYKYHLRSFHNWINQTGSLLTNLSYITGSKKNYLIIIANYDSCYLSPLDSSCCDDCDCAIEFSWSCILELRLNPPLVFCKKKDKSWITIKILNRKIYLAELNEAHIYLFVVNEIQ